MAESNASFDKLIDTITDSVKSLHQDIKDLNRENDAQHLMITESINNFKIEVTEKITRLDTVMKTRAAIAGAIPGIIGMIISIIFVYLKLNGLD